MPEVHTSSTFYPQEVKGLTTNYITMHYPGRKPVYLQIFEFIGATVSEFRFYMRLRT